MENSTVTDLRSRSRSKTPFLRSSCDRENCAGESEDHLHHKSGRKTPNRRNTPVKQIHSSSGKINPEQTIPEQDEDITPPQRTRKSARTATEKLIKTSDYSSEESLDRLKANRKENSQNEQNHKYEYERVSSSSSKQRHAGSPGDFSLSPISTGEHSYTRFYNVTGDRSRFSPAYSGCSTDSSFAEQALADASTLLERERTYEHLPYRLYATAGEYWNKYPKTDYTYSPLSRDRVELAPGQVAVPNMSRRSLSQFRAHGPNTAVDEVDRLLERAYRADLRQRVKSAECSDDEGTYHAAPAAASRWWLTRLLITIVTTITTTTTAAYEALAGPTHHRYPYTDRYQKKGLISRSASYLAAPFVWIYTAITKVVTTTVSTVTETVTPNHMGHYSTYAGQSRALGGEKGRRWWPWFLLLLVPLLGYGYYTCGEMLESQEESPVSQSYVAPIKIEPDADLIQRLAALENWAVSVDSKLKFFDRELTKLDDLEAQIESYSFKHLQRNLIQILSVNSENSEELAQKLKGYFDKHYVSKDDMHRMSLEIHERLINSWRPEMDEDSIRRIVQEYLSVFEKRQMEILVEKVREYVKEVQIHKVETGFDVDAVRKIVAGMLDVYDADKTGMVDYALESAGGQVISTKCTELYQIKTKQYSVLGMPVWWVYTSPRYALAPGAMPAECWAFQGFPGYLVVKTYAVIEVTGFSLEHMSKLLAVDGKIESAPKNFSVYGLHDEQDSDPHLFGNYVYDENGTSIQYFPVKHPKTENIGGVDYPIAYDVIELRIESNYGNPTYTCVYRFRVHGNSLSDIRKATEDSIHDSET